jgi:hypothetical protein
MREGALGKVRIDPLPAASAEPSSQGAISQKGPQGAVQPEKVVRLHEDSALAVHHDFRCAAAPKGDDRFAPGHRFKEYDPEPFLAARKHEGGASLIFPCKMACRKSAEE